MSDVKNPNNIFNSLIENARKLAFDPENLKRQQGIKMQAPELTNHALIADQLNQIQRQNSKGFQVVDVSPWLLSRAAFYPQISANDLTEILGPEGVSVGGGYYEDGNSGSLPYWRTIQLDIPGNYLCIEHLPVRLNDEMSGLDPTLAPPIQDNSAVLNNSDSFGEFSPKHSSDKLFLLQFQDNSGRAILAKHGDEFKTEFTSIFLTFKTSQPRFRITIGANSEIRHNDDRLVNSSLHMSPGTGLLNNPNGHSVPFDISDRDLNVNQYSGISSNNCIEIASGTIFNADLITNVPQVLSRCYKAGGANSDLQMSQIVAASGYQYTNDSTSAACAIVGGSFSPSNYETNGLSVGWLTGFSGSVWSETFGIASLDFIIEIVRYGGGGTSQQVIRRVLNKSFVFAPNNGSREMILWEKVFNTPIRFTLRPLDALRIAIVNNPVSTFGTTHVYTKFNLEGYTWGSLSGLGAKAGFACAPFETKFKLTENPYPLDQSWVSNPRY